MTSGIRSQSILKLILSIFEFFFFNKWLWFVAKFKIMELVTSNRFWKTFLINFCNIAYVLYVSGPIFPCIQLFHYGHFPQIMFLQ